MGEKELKVTDKRMFTADGELREEFRHLESEAAPAAEQAAPEPAAVPDAESPAAPASDPAAAPAAGADPSPSGGPSAQPRAAESAPAVDEATDSDRPPLEIPGTPEGLGAPTFLDLVTLLAEPIALYLGDAKLPSGESAENLEMARLHIDLLDVLRRKTVGNLEVGESRLLEDLLYRCRLRYVQKRD